MNRKQILLTLFLGVGSGLLGAWSFFTLFAPADQPQVQVGANTPGNAISAANLKAAQAGSLDFVAASKASINSVVFIKTISNQRPVSQDPFFDFFNLFGNRGPSYSSGSGVIISQEGYIVTNLHVIQGAQSIEVILNDQRHTFPATVVGTDPSTDLALLKIEGKKLQAISFGNSDELQVGDWVLAVGNPFNLTSTVTAGIVSAKGRNINIVNNQFPIESFIQTDAAINPGNSGGALVNLQGQLVGINTAIQSNTGSYSGYGFAIPVNMVAKIVKDLIETGEVQRGFTGMDVRNIDNSLAEKLGSINSGVLVENVIAEAPADKSGLKNGDVILKVNGKEVQTKANFDEQISYYRPGDKLKLELWRNGTLKNAEVELISKKAYISITERGKVSSKMLGADFYPVSEAERKRLGVQGGVRVANIRYGKLAYLNVQDGFIIEKYNGKVYTEPEKLVQDLENARGRVVLEGVDAAGNRAVYSIY